MIPFICLRLKWTPRRMEGQAMMIVETTWLMLRENMCRVIKKQSARLYSIVIELCGLRSVQNRVCNMAYMVQKQSTM